MVKEVSLCRFRVRGEIKKCSLKTLGVKNLPPSCPNDASCPLYNPYPKKVRVWRLFKIRNGAGVDIITLKQLMKRDKMRRYNSALHKRFECSSSLKCLL